MNTDAHNLWVEKYRPATVEQYVFHNPNHEVNIREYIENKTFPHLLFAGIHGSGKTTLARLLIKAIDIDDCDVLRINASNKRGIDTFRDDISQFASAMPLGDFKVIHLEEADRLTPQAQDALKSFMEEASDYVRFILTCNRVHMIEGPIRSRCHEFFMKPSDKDEVLEYLVTILRSEKVKFDLDTLDEYVSAAYPDVRKIVNLLQQNSTSGKLRPYSPIQAGSSDYKSALLDAMNADDWAGARQIVVSSVREEEWEDFFTYLYENLDRVKKFKDKTNWETAIVLIAEHLYRHTLVAVPYINASSLLIQLGSI